MYAEDVPEKYARRLIQIHGLTPPINIVDLCRRYAQYIEVPFEPFPQVDGVVIGLKTSKQVIYINKLNSLRRRRFTAAHELGHVIIPWHRGDIVEAPTPDDADDPTIKKFVAAHDRAIEDQADRFAAEILMPLSWVQSLAASARSQVDLTVKIASEALVSIPAAALRASSILKDEGTLVISFVDGRILYRIRNGAYVRSLKRFGTLEDILRSQNHALIEKISYVNYEVSLFRPNITSIPEVSQKYRSWRTALKNCLSENYSDGAERADALARINGIVAYNAAVALRHSQLELYSALILRFEGDPDFGFLLNEVKFIDFLVLRSAHFVAKHNADQGITISLTKE